MSRWRKVIAISIMLVIVGFGLIIRASLINNSFPYVVNGDEPHVTVPALKILQTGDFNPHFFRYPSLPIYLTTAGFSIGFLISRTRADLFSTEGIGSVDYPYYENSGVAYPARLLFCFLSVVAMVLGGVLAYKIFKIDELLFLVPLMLSLSDQFLTMSWKYINVDIVGVFFAMLVLYSLFRYSDWKGVFHRAILPGFLCGLTIGCKYNLVFILLPCILFSVIYDRKRCVSNSLLIVLFAALGFLLVVPFAVLDFNKFINDVGYEMYHYSSGHFGRTVEAGLPHLWINLRDIAGDFGWLSPFLAIAGIIAMIRWRWRESVVLLSFPVTFLLFMSFQRAHFMRNMISVFVIYALVAAVGLVAITRFTINKLKKTGYFSTHPTIRSVAVYGILIVLLAISLPWPKVFSTYDLTPDSRILAVRWINENVPGNSEIILPLELGMDTRSLERKYRVIKAPMKWLSFEEIKKILAEHQGSYILSPKYGRDSRWKDRNVKPADLNECLRTKIKPFVDFGKLPVLENYNKPVANGDPLFTIGRVKDIRRWRNSNNTDL